MNKDFFNLESKETMGRKNKDFFLMKPVPKDSYYKTDKKKLGKGLL